MCVHSNSSLAMAMTTAYIIENILSRRTDYCFSLNHIDEMAVNVDVARIKLRCVEVVNMANQVMQNFKSYMPGSDKAHLLNLYRGFSCKALSILFSNAEEVLVTDYDVIHLIDPWHLADTYIYQQGGAFLFRDRLSGKKEWGGSFQEKKELYQNLREGLKLTKDDSLHKYPALTYESNEIGESATVLINRKKYPNVLNTLFYLHMPGVIEAVYDNHFGDKDTYSLAFALSGLSPPFNNFMSTAMGVNEHDMCVRAPDGSASILAQYVDGKLFYVNGDPLEDATIVGKSLRALGFRYISSAQNHTTTNVMHQLQVNAAVSHTFCTVGKPLRVPQTLERSLYIRSKVFQTIARCIFLSNCHLLPLAETIAAIRS